MGQKPVTEIILRKKLLRTQQNLLKRNERSSGQLRSVSAPFGSAHQAWLGWLSLRPPRRTRPILGLLGTVSGGSGCSWLSSLNLQRLRLSLVWLALDKVNRKPGLAAKVVEWPCAPERACGLFHKGASSSAND